MGLFTSKRKDAKLIKPKDTIQAIVPFIMPKRCDAEVSSRYDIDITELVKFVDIINPSLKTVTLSLWLNISSIL